MVHVDICTLFYRIVFFIVEEEMTEEEMLEQALKMSMENQWHIFSGSYIVIPSKNVDHSMVY